jgi:KaiC/GvpD/RAD55 family RecA-like ATPase
VGNQDEGINLDQAKTELIDKLARMVRAFRDVRLPLPDEQIERYFAQHPWVLATKDEPHRFEVLIGQARSAAEFVVAGDAVTAFPLELFISSDALVKMELAEREALVIGLLWVQSLVQIHAWRGIGKTWIALHLAVAIASGKPFLAWGVLKARRVLYVDGEMALIELRQRVLALSGGQVPDLLELMPSELVFGQLGAGLILNDLDQQAKFLATLDALKALGRQPEVLIFDNLSSLTTGTDENSNTEQDELLAFFRGLRHAGYTVAFVHHDGKNGQQRGASRREDFLDLVIHLTEDTSAPRDPPSFRFEFTKTRGRRPTPSEFAVTITAGEHGGVTLAMEHPGERRGQEPEPMQREHVLLFIHQETVAGRAATRTTVKEHFGLGKSAANTHVQKLIDGRLLSGAAGPLKVTKSGMDHLSRVFPKVVF